MIPPGITLRFPKGSRVTLTNPRMRRMRNSTGMATVVGYSYNGCIRVLEDGYKSVGTYTVEHWQPSPDLADKGNSSETPNSSNSPEIPDSSAGLATNEESSVHGIDAQKGGC